MNIATWWKDYHGEVRAALLRLTNVQDDPATRVTVRGGGRVFDEQVGAWLVTVSLGSDGVQVWFGPSTSRGWQAKCLDWNAKATGALGLEWLVSALEAAETMTRRHTGYHSHLLHTLRHEAVSASTALEVYEAGR